MRLLGALALAVVGVALLVGSFAAAGARVGEPVQAVCLDHQPSGWFEDTRADEQWTTLPPRTRCELANPRTGEVARWDSASTSVPLFVGAMLAGAGAAALVAWSLLGAMANGRGSTVQPS